MFTDIVGYTSLSQRDEASAIRLLEEHRGIVREFFPKHNGTEIKTMGDGFLVEFASALEAVRCAYDIQQSLHELNNGRPQEAKVMVRIGIHLGDVIHAQNDVYGDAVNIASRIEPLSEPGGICVTSQVYEQVRNKFEFPMTTLGKRGLKNVGDPIEVYQVVLPWARDMQDARPDSAHRVAVLPFTNMSPDPNDEYFADGMTEEVISTVSSIEGIEVISRTSVMQYKKAPKPIREVSRELEVGTVLEGSVRKAGTKVRVTVQMIDAGRDRHVWAESYDRDLQDIFVIQSEIASKVAGALQSRLPRAGVGNEAHREDIEAYTSYMKATQRLHEDTEQSLRESEALFRRAISRDPAFARAYAGLAKSICQLAVRGFEDFTTLPKAEEAAGIALRLAPGDAEPHSAMAIVHTMLDRFEESAKETRTALEINPNLADAHIEMMMYYSTHNMMDEACRAAKKSHELDPLSFRPAYFLGFALLMSGKIREAEDTFKMLCTLNPSNPFSYTALCECHMVAGDFASAQSAIEKAEKIGPDAPSVVIDRGLLYASTGKRKEAEEILERTQRNEKESVRLYSALCINCGLGRIDEAFKALMRSAETHSWPYMINVSPLFKDLRADPRFSEFLDKVGLSSMIGKV
jgi:TolB-like protein/Flp pilus assembly protein TadD